MISHHYWTAALQGLLLALVLLIPFTIIQERWVKAHADLVQKLFDGMLSVPQ